MTYAHLKILSTLIFPVAVNFDQETYTVEECQGVLEVCLSTNTSVLARDVAVSLFTLDLEAEGELTGIHIDIIICSSVIHSRFYWILLVPY